MSLYRGPKKLIETIARCPACGRRGLKISEYLHEVPLVGLVILSSGRCTFCGYRFSDVRMAESRGPQKITLRVSRPEDLNILVVKASTATVKVPELGFEMRPGPASQGFITTIEGLLHRFVEALELACSSEEADAEACRERRGMLSKAIEGKIPFTLEIEDPEGVSSIISDRAVREKLYETGKPSRNNIGDE